MCSKNLLDALPINPHITCLDKQQLLKEKTRSGLLQPPTQALEIVSLFSYSSQVCLSFSVRKSASRHFRRCCPQWWHRLTQQQVFFFFFLPDISSQSSRSDMSVLTVPLFPYSLIQKPSGSCQTVYSFTG